MCIRSELSVSQESNLRKQASIDNPSVRFIIAAMPKGVTRAASLMGKLSAEARRKKWGAKEFARRMKEWGKLGGRPKRQPVRRKEKKGK
jgi:hypothetical protein